ncbi:MAG: DUF3313 family protein [Candidatus Brocadiales bacterium]
MNDTTGRVNLPFIVILIISLCFIASCAAKPHEETGFLGDHPEMKQTVNFHRLYIEPGTDFKTYKNVVIREVNTSHLPEFKWYDNTYGEEELKEVTEHTEKEFANALGGNYLIIKERPDYATETLILELALVKLAPVDKYSNVVSSALIYIPVSKGEVAIEGKLMDANSEKLVLMFTDARLGKQNVGNIKDFAKFMHAKDIINEWATELCGIMQMGQAEREGYFSGTFELKPW